MNNLVKSCSRLLFSNLLLIGSAASFAAPPVPENDNYETLINIPINLSANDLMSNDTDTTGQLTVAWVGSSQNGSVTLDPCSNGVNFTPTVGFNGAAGFEYLVVNADGETAKAVVNITVNSPDTDGDGVIDSEDAFPNDATETIDTDGDGVGNNADVFDNDPTETADTDGDGVGDNKDLYPNDASRNVGIWREWWLGLSGPQVSDLTQSPNFPDSPDADEQVNNFAGPINWGSSYGTRIRGVFYAPVSGDYTFWVTSDNNSELYLSDDGNAANKVLIANVPVAVNPNDWGSHPEQQSLPITLVAGQPYYLEVLHKQWGARDHVNVGWQLPNETAIQIIPGEYFTAPDGDGDTVLDTIDNCPVDANADQLDSDGDGIGDACDATPNGDGVVSADILPSRTSCTSPCTVVFSAERTTADGLDEHGVWSQLSYHWDFDTDESDTHGALYNQNYTYVNGDTAFESGHVPLVTKTFLCETGSCTYTVGMRAQNVAGDYDDAYQTITVNSESSQWNSANTVCVSNTLNTADDWTGYDKACPVGATKQSALPLAGEYGDKLILLKRGDTFNYGLATLPNESNFKITGFGNAADNKPNVSGVLELGHTRIFNQDGGQAANYNNITDALVASLGWPSNIYIEGIAAEGFNLPMSYNQVGIHDIDLDRSAYTDGGFINVNTSSDYCYNNDSLSCSNVPLPKGGYISSVNIVGFSGGNGGPGVNIVQTACSMVNFLGVTDMSVQRTREHHLRIAGWYRMNVMRSLFRGEHELPSKQKITPRGCIRSGSLAAGWEGGGWKTQANLPATWADPIMNADGTMKTRAETEAVGSPGEFVHTSRFQVVAHNQIGDSSAPVGTRDGGTFYQTNALDPELWLDIVIAHNTFDYDQGNTDRTSFIALQSTYGTCVANIYPGGINGCFPSTQDPERFFRREPAPVTPPLAPGL